MLAVFRGKIKTGRRTEAIGFSSHWRILGLEKFDLSAVCARARLRPAPSQRFPRDLHHLLRGIVVGSGSYNAQWFRANTPSISARALDRRCGGDPCGKGTKTKDRLA